MDEAVWVECKIVFWLSRANWLRGGKEARPQRDQRRAGEIHQFKLSKDREGRLAVSFERQKVQRSRLCAQTYREQASRKVIRGEKRSRVLQPICLRPKKTLFARTSAYETSQHEPTSLPQLPPSSLQPKSSASKHHAIPSRLSSQ